MKFLSNIQKDFYSQNGFIKLENLLSTEEIEEASNAYSDLFKVDYFFYFLFYLDKYLYKKYLYSIREKKKKMLICQQFGKEVGKKNLPMTLIWALLTCNQSTIYK